MARKEKTQPKAKKSKISKKEIIAILRFCAAGFCLGPFILLTMNFEFPEDYKMFAFQCALLTTSALCIFLGLSVWFYNSSRSRVRYQSNILWVTVLWLMFIALLVSGVFWLEQYKSNSFEGQFKLKDFFNPKEVNFLRLMGLIALIGALILLVANIFSTILLIKKHKKFKAGHKASRINK